MGAGRGLGWTARFPVRASSQCHPQVSTALTLHLCWDPGVRGLLAWGVAGALEWPQDPRRYSGASLRLMVQVKITCVSTRQKCSPADHNGGTPPNSDAPSAQTPLSALLSSQNKWDSHSTAATCSGQKRVPTGDAGLQPGWSHTIKQQGRHCPLSPGRTSGLQTDVTGTDMKNWLSWGRGKDMGQEQQDREAGSRF